jgi:hypothetical protein
MCFDEALYLRIAILGRLKCLGALSVLVCNLILQKSYLLGEILNAVDPIVEDQARVQRFAAERHPLDEVDGKIVSLETPGKERE